MDVVDAIVDLIIRNPLKHDLEIPHNLLGPYKQDFIEIITNLVGINYTDENKIITLDVSLPELGGTWHHHLYYHMHTINWAKSYDLATIICTGEPDVTESLVITSLIKRGYQVSEEIIDDEPVWIANSRAVHTQDSDDYEHSWYTES